MEVSKAYQGALNYESPERDLALKKRRWKACLVTSGNTLKISARNNRSYRACSLLVFITMALFAGRDTLTSIQRYGNLLTSQQRLWLGFPLKKGTNTRKVPSWNALYNFLTQIKPKAFSKCLNLWLEGNLGRFFAIYRGRMLYKPGVLNEWHGYTGFMGSFQRTVHKNHAHPVTSMQ